MLRKGWCLSQVSTLITGGAGARLQFLRFSPLSPRQEHGGVQVDMVLVTS